jgi:hypothetical protein
MSFLPLLNQFQYFFRSYPLSRDAGRAVPSGMRLEAQGERAGEQDNYETLYSISHRKERKGRKDFVAMLYVAAIPKCCHIP